MLPNAESMGLIPGKGAKISHAEWHGQNNTEALHHFTSVIKSGPEFQFSSVQLSRSVHPTLCNPMDCTTPGFPVHHQNSWSLLKLMSIASVMPFNHLILCHPLFLPPSIFPSIRVFPNESACHIRWPKYWSFSSTSFLPMNI